MKPDSDSPSNHQWEKGLAYNIIETEKKIEFCLVIMLIWISVFCILINVLT